MLLIVAAGSFPQVFPFSSPVCRFPNHEELNQAAAAASTTHVHAAHMLLLSLYKTVVDVMLSVPPLM